jgi:Tfp pilus assembly protein PilF
MRPPLVLVFVLAVGCGAGTLPRQALVHNAAGARLLAKGHLDDAEARFRLALEYHPRFSDAHANLGVVALHRGDPAMAEVHLRRATRLNEDFAIAYANLGVALERQERPEEAETAYEAALAVDPGIVHARMDLARLLVRQSRFRETRAHLMRLVQVDPGSIDAQGLLAYVDLRLGRPDAAEERVERLLEEHPGAPVGRLVRGIIRGLRGELDGAGADFVAALDDPLVGEAARLRLSVIRLEQGRHADAERTLTPLLADHGDDPAVALVRRRLARSHPEARCHPGSGDSSIVDRPAGDGPCPRDEGRRASND